MLQSLKEVWQCASRHEAQTALRRIELDELREQLQQKLAQPKFVLWRWAINRHLRKQLNELALERVLVAEQELLLGKIKDHLRQGSFNATRRTLSLLRYAIALDNRGIASQPLEARRLTERQRLGKEDAELRQAEKFLLQVTDDLEPVQA